MLKRDTFPPDADITYESFFERAMQGTASSTLVSLMSLVIKIPLGGCHNWGAKLAVACHNQSTLSKIYRFLANAGSYSLDIWNPQSSYKTIHSLRARPWYTPFSTSLSYPFSPRSLTWQQFHCRIKLALPKFRRVEFFETRPTLPVGLRSLRCHFQSLCTAFVASASKATPAFVYINRDTCTHHPAV